MMKIYLPDNSISEYSEHLNVVTASTSLVKELINREDYSTLNISFDESEEKISLENVFILQVNIKESASCFFAFPLENFQKDEVINKVAALKKIKVIDLSSSKNKTSELFNAVKEFKPYFIIYQVKNGISLYKGEVEEVFNETGLNETSYLFFIPKEEPVIEEKKEEAPSKEEVAPVEEAPEVEEKKESSEEEKPSKLKDDKFKEFKNYVMMDINNIKKNKYHFIFLTISSFLFGFASSVGFCNAMIGKLITILFFICAAVGLFLNTYVYVDYFKEFKFKSRMFVYSILFNILGMGVSLGAAMIFYALDKSDIKTTVSAGTLIGVTAAMSVISILLAVTIGYVVVYFGRKAKAKKYGESKEDLVRKIEEEKEKKDE
ncbi:MAG: hypothetical protein J5955_00140 [Bacilli bacterium]|nr:hypothetical protein [Bacilli bacterium]